MAIIAIYVDDLVLIAKPGFDHLKEQIKSRFACKEMGPSSKLCSWLKNSTQRGTINNENRPKSQCFEYVATFWT